MTLVNAVGEKYRVWIVFFFTMIYSVMGHMFLYFFEEKKKSFKSKLHEDPTELTEVDISNHSLILKGIGTHVPLERAEEKLS